MKLHLKRISAPKTWILDRKRTTFILRPKPSGHAMENGLPLGIIIRDVLKLTKTLREVKKLLNNQEVLVDSKRKKDSRCHLGLFDILSFPSLKKSYHLIFDIKGRVILREIPTSNQKTCKVVGKTILPKKKIQLHLHDGKNILCDKEIKVGDSVILSLPDLKVKEVLNLKPGVLIYLIKGKYQGDHGKLKEIRDNEAIYTRDGKEIETSKRYLFVIQDKHPITMKQEDKA